MWLGSGSILREEHIGLTDTGYEIKRCLRMMPGSWPDSYRKGAAIG